MPIAEEKARGGVKYYRTKNLPGGKYIHLGIVPKAGPKGGHTVAGPEHTVKSPAHDGSEYKKKFWKGRKSD